MILRAFSLFFACIFVSIPLAGHELVDLRSVAPTIQIDMRYARNDNPFGYPIYSSAKCYVVREVGEKLQCVQRELEKRGYGLRVFDAYRPQGMQALFSGVQNGACSEIIPYFYDVEDFHGHNRGTAVDVTLICLSDGQLAMPTNFGSYSSRTPRDCQELPPHTYHNKQLLEKMMKQYGFIPSPGEWWHFDYQCYSNYPVLDIPFEELIN